MNTAKSTRNGFTLVELMIVVAIIGVLVAMILPAIMYAQEASRRSACSSNMRQVGIANLAYVDVYLQFPTGNHFFNGYSTCPPQPVGIGPFLEDNVKGATVLSTYKQCPLLRGSTSVAVNYVYSTATAATWPVTGTPHQSSVLSPSIVVTMQDVMAGNGTTNTALLAHQGFGAATGGETGGQPEYLTDVADSSVWINGGSSQSSNFGACNFGSPHAGVHPYVMVDAHVNLMPYSWPVNVSVNGYKEADVTGQDVQIYINSRWQLWDWMYVNPIIQVGLP